jgi:predicted transcriptional regulator
MTDLLKNELNLNLLRFIVKGVGVEINISELSKKLKKHRNTIKTRVNELIKNKIINKPQYPYLQLFKELPLMVVSRHNFLRDQKTKNFIENNDHIFAAFFFKEEEYNTLMISFHENVCTHQQWYDKTIRDQIIPYREEGYSSEVIHLGTGCFEKYNPSISIKVIEEDIKEKRFEEIKGYKIDKLSFDILKSLLRGDGIRTNENYLANVLNVHRKTIERRINTLHKAGIIGRPICRFPKLIVPPTYILVKSLFQIKKQHNNIIKNLKSDHHVSWMIKAVTGKGGYNLVVFSTFYKIEDHLKWQEKLDQDFPSCIGAIKDTYLSPAMTFSIDPEYVSSCLIKNKICEIGGK